MIEKNVPYTDATTYQGWGHRLSSYPFMEMEVGDSIFIEGAKNTSTCKAYKAATAYSSRYRERKFSARKVEGGVRIWRIA